MKDIVEQSMEVNSFIKSYLLMVKELTDLGIPAVSASEHANSFMANWFQYAANNHITDTEKSLFIGQETED